MMHKVLVRDALGVPILCCWDDCGQWADNRWFAIYGPNRVRYTFCCEGHRDFWTHSHIDLGNKAPGSRTSAPGVIKR